MTRLRRVATWIFLLGLFLATSLGIAYEVADHRLTHAWPLRPAAPPLWMAPDLSMVGIRVTASWEKLPETTTVFALERDPTIWRRMLFDDWDLIPDPLRARVVDEMFRHYRRAMEGPAEWTRMTAFDWDDVPQPIRAMAFIRMSEYWNEHYGVGIAHDVPRRLVADTMGALVMVESWFEHRAVQESRGNRDLGLSQASDFCRARLDTLSAGGFVDFAMTEADYFDPWKATRVVAVWFDLMLTEANGDLDLAVRAYHRGVGAARRGAGDDYLTHVRRVRRRFIRNEADEHASPTWQQLWARVRHEFGPTGAVLSREEPALVTPFDGLAADDDTAAGAPAAPERGC
jgi:hypothetical protein